LNKIVNQASNQVLEKNSMVLGLIEQNNGSKRYSNST